MKVTDLTLLYIRIYFYIIVLIILCGLFLLSMHINVGITIVILTLIAWVLDKLCKNIMLLEITFLVMNAENVNVQKVRRRIVVNNTRVCPRFVSVNITNDAPYFEAITGIFFVPRGFYSYETQDTGVCKK